MKRALVILALLLGSFGFANAQTNFYAETPNGVLNFEIENTINPADFDGKVFTMSSRPSSYVEVRFNNEFGSGAFTMGVGDASTCTIIYWLCDLFGWSYPTNPC